MIERNVEESSEPPPAPETKAFYDKRLDVVVKLMWIVHLFGTVMTMLNHLLLICVFETAAQSKVKREFESVDIAMFSLLSLAGVKIAQMACSTARPKTNKILYVQLLIRLFLTILVVTFNIWKFNLKYVKTASTIFFSLEEWYFSYVFIKKLHCRQWLAPVPVSIAVFVAAFTFDRSYSPLTLGYILLMPATVLFISVIVIDVLHLYTDIRLIELYRERLSEWNTNQRSEKFFEIQDEIRRIEENDFREMVDLGSISREIEEEERIEGGRNRNRKNLNKELSDTAQSSSPAVVPSTTNMSKESASEANHIEKPYRPLETELATQVLLVNAALDTLRAQVPEARKSSRMMRPIKSLGRKADKGLREETQPKTIDDFIESLPPKQRD